MPGKKDFVSVKGEHSRQHVQKRLILSKLKELYQDLKQKHPTEGVGFSKFTGRRPKHCILAARYEFARANCRTYNISPLSCRDDVQSPTSKMLCWRVWLLPQNRKAQGTPHHTPWWELDWQYYLRTMDRCRLLYSWNHDNVFRWVCGFTMWKTRCTSITFVYRNPAEQVLWRVQGILEARWGSGVCWLFWKVCFCSPGSCARFSMEQSIHNKPFCCLLQRITQP